VLARTLTTADSGLLEGVRKVLREADEALLCVAFASQQGVHLLHRELHRLGDRTRLLVTTQFGTTTGPALATAAELGARVRVLNPAGARTYHPKVYLGRTGSRIAAVVGSANLTGGLVSNIEAACHLVGRRSDAALAEAWTRADAWWNDARAQPFVPAAAEPPPEPDWGTDPHLFALVQRAARENPVVETLGAKPKPNVVTRVTPGGVYVDTESSRRKGIGPQLVPSWMIGLAWDYLRAHGTLTNRYLLDILHVHRSSFVCALLARLPGVTRRPGRAIALAWTGSAP